MKLASLRTPDGPRAARIHDDHAVLLDAPDLGALLTDASWRERAESTMGPHLAANQLDYAPLIPRPPKIVCVGLNYRKHILEMGRELPEHPTLFAKFAPALIGAHDDVLLPAESGAMDWEAELGVVIGGHGRRLSKADAESVIGGYTVINDVTARDWQYRGAQWLQGKTFADTTPVGPWLVTDPPASGLELTCQVDGRLVQQADTADLVFDPATLVAYVSTIVPLEPGDLIATGTPGGVGYARTPAQYLTDGSELVTAIEGIGVCRNLCRAERTRTPSAARP
jgi:acylpyruvate hydrolase